MTKQEFDKKELANSNRIFKSATPKYTLDWYVKWTASFFILISMSMRGIEGLQFIDLCFSLIGVTGWCIVGVLWKDRALILLNGVGVALLLRTLFGTIV
jgi:hypothetical protein